MFYLRFLFFLGLFIVCFSSKAYEVKIIAKVNDEIITNIDLDNRLKMTLDLSNLPNEKEVKDKLMPRVLDSLIDESLKIQEANRLGVFVTNQEVMAQINRLEKRLNLKKNTLLDNYKKKDIPEITILNQVRSQLLWEKMLYGIVIRNITISEKTILETYDLLLQTSGETEYNISEIFVSLNNVEAEQRINSIYNRVNSQNFLLLAEQFSDGVVFLGDMRNNWIRESLLNEEIQKAVSQLNVGNISVPIKSSDGYHLILLNNKRKTKKIEEDQTIYHLSQILFKINSSESLNNETYYKEFLSYLRSIVNGCSDLKKLIEEIPEGIGGELGRVDSKSIENGFLQVNRNS